MASTESFFKTFGHGSPPKFSGDTVTLHEFCPTQFCRKKKSLLINETSISDNQIRMVANLTFRLEPKRFHFRAFSTAKS